jgi:transcription antitermination factor NusA-like protein
LCPRLRCISSLGLFLFIFAQAELNKRIVYTGGLTMAKRALVIGGNGTIGSVVVSKLKERQIDVITASRNHGDYTLDMRSPASIQTLFEKIK